MICTLGVLAARCLLDEASEADAEPLERLMNSGVQAVRLGHPARVLDVVRTRTLDALVEKHESRALIEDLTREADQLERSASRYTRARPARGQCRFQCREQIVVPVEVLQRLLACPGIVESAASLVRENIMQGRNERRCDGELAHDDSRMTMGILGG